MEEKPQSKFEAQNIFNKDQSTLTLKTFPLNKNKLLVRVTNLADKIDQNAENKFFNLHEYAKNFYYQVNG